MKGSFLKQKNTFFGIFNRNEPHLFSPRLIFLVKKREYKKKKEAVQMNYHDNSSCL